MLIYVNIEVRFIILTYISLTKCFDCVHLCRYCERNIRSKIRKNLKCLELRFCVFISQKSDSEEIFLIEYKLQISLALYISGFT